MNASNTAAVDRSEHAEHKRRSRELWQQLAPRWEHGRAALWEPTEPVSEWLADALAPEPGQTVLELAAGVGETGFLVASRLGEEGRLISSDFAPEMAAAAERVAASLGIANADFRTLDAERLDLEDASVDGVVCRFGFMLMRDPELALRETRRVLRDGGRLALAVFGDRERNPWMTLPFEVMIERGHLTAPDPSEPGMFAMSSPYRIRALLEGAGFSHQSVEELPIRFRFEDADRLWAYISELQGPIALAIARLDDEERSAIRASVEERFDRFRDGAGFEIPGLALGAVAR